MPLRELDGKTYVTLWDEVVLPKDAPMIPGPDPGSWHIGSVELGFLERIIHEHAHDKAIYSGAG